MRAEMTKLFTHLWLKSSLLLSSLLLFVIFLGFLFLFALFRLVTILLRFFLFSLVGLLRASLSLFKLVERFLALPAVLKQRLKLSEDLVTLLSALPKLGSQLLENIVLSVTHLLGVILFDHLLKLFHAFLGLSDGISSGR